MTWKTAAALSALVLCQASAADAWARQPAPRNPALADSTWPIFHQSPYAQASGPFAAPDGTGPVRVQRLDNPERGTSPWTVLAEPYSDGSQAAFGTVQTGVIKWLIDGERFERVSYVPLPRGRFDFDWNIAVLRSGEVVATSIRENAIYLLKDARPDCPRCELAISRVIRVPRSVGRLTIHFSIGYDGRLFVLMEDDKIAAVSLEDGRVLAVHDLGLGPTDYGYHNAFAMDETGRIYLMTQEAVTALDWDGRRFSPAWRVAYDFRGPGCREPRRTNRLRERLRVVRGQTCTGSGTTPTLIGSPRDGVLVVVDGHAPSNNLVAFWRDEIPADWAGLPGLERRVAGKVALPLSTPAGEGFSAENSPAVVGNSIFVAQWAGFRPDCDPPKGVQRVDWRPDRRRLEVAWAAPEVHFNGVPTASSATNLVYGSGVGPGCELRYRGLDLATGEIRLDVPLGTDRAFLDQGNQQAVAADGSILVGVSRGAMRLSPVRASPIRPPAGDRP